MIRHGDAIVEGARVGDEGRVGVEAGPCGLEGNVRAGRREGGRGVL